MSQTDSPPSPLKRALTLTLAGMALSATVLVSTHSAPTAHEQVVTASAAFQPALAHLWEPPTTTTTAPPTTTTTTHQHPRPSKPAPKPAAPKPAAPRQSGGGDPSDPASWDRLAQCESGGNWSANTGNGYSGGLQHSPSTWNAYGGQAYAPYAYQASREQQIATAQRVQAAQGWSAWPSCTRSFGWR